MTGAGLQRWKGRMVDVCGIDETYHRGMIVSVEGGALYLALRRSEDQTPLPPDDEPVMAINLREVESIVLVPPEEGPSLKPVQGGKGGKVHPLRRPADEDDA